MPEAQPVREVNPMQFFKDRDEAVQDVKRDFRPQVTSIPQPDAAVAVDVTKRPLDMDLDGLDERARPEVDPDDVPSPDASVEEDLDDQDEGFSGLLASGEGMESTSADASTDGG